MPAEEAKSFFDEYDSSPTSGAASAVRDFRKRPFGSPDFEDADLNSAFRRSLLSGFLREVAGVLPLQDDHYIDSGDVWRWHVEVRDANNRLVSSVRVNATNKAEALRVAARRIDSDRVLGDATPYRKAVET
jgi:hypothetical protein